jgi:tRNA1Val (adenine37-N6)-methyltransferase
MPNAYFRFKQFTIHQDGSVMKVCTDSCVLGAWSALHTGGSERILDIGTGTALLSLMLAQKSSAPIDAIEWDPEACAQARENIRASPWPTQIKVIQADARTYRSPLSYDFIISNPPFFESDLRSTEDKKNIAKHGTSFTLEALLGVIKTNLQLEGVFTILLPFHRTEYFENLALQQGFYLQQHLILRQTPTHPPFRSICLFAAKKSVDVAVDRWTIKNDQGKNSLEFVQLMRDYYGEVQ